MLRIAINGESFDQKIKKNVIGGVNDMCRGGWLSDLVKRAQMGAMTPISAIKIYLILTMYINKFIGAIFINILRC